MLAEAPKRLVYHSDPREPTARLNADAGVVPQLLYRLLCSQTWQNSILDVRLMQTKIWLYGSQNHS